MQQDVHIFTAGGKRLPIQQDLIDLRVSGLTKAGNGAVDRYPAIHDHCFRCPPGSNAPGGEYLL